MTRRMSAALSMKENIMRSEPIQLPEHGKTRMIAHRGASCLECENTAAAFIAAGNRSYWGMETDIFRTIDRQ